MNEEDVLKRDTVLYLVIFNIKFPHQVKVGNSIQADDCFISAKRISFNLKVPYI